MDLKRHARIALICASVMLAVHEGWSADATRSQTTDVVTLNFVNADIEGVVKAVGEITGKNFLLDPRVKGTVNIISAKPIARSMVYDVFLSALRLQGFTVIESRGISKIIPESDAKLNVSPTYGPDDKARAAGDEIRTQVFALKYESAQQMVPILRPLITPNNTITAYPNNNTLVVTDYASNLARIDKIIESIDQPSGNDGIVIPLKHASAIDMAQTVNRLFAEAPQGQAAPGAPADSTQRMVIVPDTRSNSLLARSDNPSRLARLRSLVAMLDTPTSAAGNMHVVFLKNAEAVKIAETLRAVYQSGGSAVQRPAAAPVTPLGASLAQSNAPTPGGSSGGQMQNSAPLSFSNQNQPAATAPGIIQADAATNSIIITAPDPIYNDLRAVIEKLDTRRAQVYIEALIVEVNANKAAEFGVQWQDFTGAASNNSQPFGGTSFGGPGQNIFGIAQNAASAGPGLSVGVIKGTITIPGVGQILNMNLLVRALQQDTSANILSTPTLLTTDNEEARIVVGQNLPFITGQYALSGSATTPTPFQTIQRQDVGVQLRIKPQISAGGTVRLQLYQEVSSVDPTTTANSAGPTTNKRSVESLVLVDDGQIAVIGGLIQDNQSDTTQKVPVLGDLPLFGPLFQYKTRSRSKTNLLVFLRPTVLRDGRSVDSVTNERYEYIRGEQDKARAQGAATNILPNVGGPALPPLAPSAAPAR